MTHSKMHLKDFFPQLSENGCDPVVEMFLPYDDITEMNHQNRKRPTMIVCPGGGYYGCSERESGPIAMHFLPEGYNVFVITYSVFPHHFPTQIREVAALMELIYKNAEEWRCDTDKIGIIGFSAGGHLAGHYSTMYNCPEVREMFPESKPVNFTVLSYPVVSADPKQGHMGSFVGLLGTDQLTPEQIEYFSINKQVTPFTPPTFIWHTAEDSCVPVMNSIIYAEALSKNNVPFELHIYPYGSHGLATSDKLTNDDVTEVLIHDAEWLNSLKKWLKLMKFTEQ